MASEHMTTPRHRPAWALTVLAVSVMFSMSVWFSASFVVPQLSADWGLGAGQSSLLTIAVQLGFVVGALGVSATGLADRFSGRRLMLVGALGAAVANGLILVAPGFAVALLARALTGVLLAAVYPPAMKEAASWFSARRGLALGIMIGALTLGSAAPHLVKAALILVIVAAWGFWVIADSAQFSAILTEDVEPAYVGSAVSFQLALGYLTTAITIYLVPVLVESVSWSAALLVLAVGPIVGAVAMILHIRMKAAS